MSVRKFMNTNTLDAMISDLIEFEDYTPEELEAHIKAKIQEMRELHRV